MKLVGVGLYSSPRYLKPLAAIKRMTDYLNDRKVKSLPTTGSRPEQYIRSYIEMINDDDLEWIFNNIDNKDDRTSIYRLLYNR